MLPVFLHGNEVRNRCAYWNAPHAVPSGERLILSTLNRPGQRSSLFFTIRLNESGALDVSKTKRQNETSKCQTSKRQNETSKSQNETVLKSAIEVMIVWISYAVPTEELPFNLALTTLVSEALICTIRLNKNPSRGRV